MCGIVGILGFNKPSVNYHFYLERCLNSMKRRGPDDNGIWSNNKNYSTAFVRLAIRDLSTNGHQPMVSNCGKYVITFNGEIYNSDNFIGTLKKLGVVFKSSSDTEVLLYAIIHFGLQKVLDEFDGMFAFSFYNIEKKELIIARDRVGIKPLYIGYSNDYLIYSSQYDHIINVDFIRNNTLDYQAIGNYLSYGYILAGEGVVKNTFSLPQGHYLITNNNSFEVKKYYDFATPKNIVPSNLEEILETSTLSQLVSDVPVGTFLSGGADSPLINFWANKKQQVNAFTIGSQEKYFDESFYAKEYARKIGVQHNFKIITENDFLELLNDNFKAFSEPFADFSSIPTMLVSKMAKEKVTVILSGDGPDELFWGYSRNIDFLRKAELFKKGKISLGIKKILGNKSISKRYFTATSLSHFYLQSLQTYGAEVWMPKVYNEKIITNKIFEMLPSHLQNDTKTNNYMQMARWLEMNIHLQRILLKVDRSTMYYSLEARVPYLANNVLDYASSLNYTDCINKNESKINTKQILATKVPKEWVYKKKQGFGVPMKEWLQNEIKTDVYNTIMNMPEELSVAFNKTQLNQLLQNEYSLNSKSSNNVFIWAIYALVKWHSLFRSSSNL